MLPDDLDRALYAELVPHRISSPPFGVMADGPTACFAELLLDRERWAMVADFEDAYPSEDVA